MATRVRRWALVAILASAALASAGCGTAGEDSPSQGSTPNASTTPGGGAQVSVGLTTIAATTTTGPPSLFEFVDYRVSGGIAGVNDHLKVYPDGRATYDAGTTVTNFTVAPSTVAELRAALEGANIASVPPVNGAPTPDAFEYRVIFGGRSVRFVDGATPASLAPAVAILNRELARGKAGR